MDSKKVTKFITALIDRLEPDATLELDSVEYSPRYGHEICVMQLVGKNAFPKMTPEEILSSPKIMAGLSREDLVIITRLDLVIRKRKSEMSLVELDLRSGTVVLETTHGDTKRYSERDVSNSPDILKSLPPEAAHGIGYRVGFKDGVQVSKEKKQLSASVKQFMSRLVPGFLK